MRNALRKAHTARLPRGSTGFVIGADTMLYFQGRLIGKPKTMRQAARLLLALGGRSHWVYTGLCVRAIATGKTRVSYEKTKVTFKSLTPALVARLLARMFPLDKAGGYALQEDRGELIARIDGSRSNVIGLPLERLRQELSAFGSESS
jgi:septum formation protein